MKKILFTSLICLNLSVQAQWAAQSSGTVDHLSSVFFANSNVGYLASYGYVIKTTNGGANWNSIAGTDIYGGTPLVFTSVDTGYAFGMNGVLKTVDGANSWVDNFPFSNIANGTLNFPTKNVGYAACQNASLDSFFVYKTINAGNSWALAYSGTTSTFCETRSIFFTDAMTGSMAIYGGGIYKTTDGGYSWALKLSSGTGLGIGPDLAACIHFPSSTIGYSITDDSVYKTTDAGETWLPIAAPPSSMIYNTIFFTDVDTGYAGGGNGFSVGGIQKTVDGGNTWTLSNTNPNTFQSIHFPNSAVGYACGQNGIIYKYSPGVGIAENERDIHFSVYPNPSSGLVRVKYDTSGKNATLRLLDITGKLVQVYDLPPAHENHQLDLTSLEAGTYFIDVLVNNEAVEKDKLIIIK